MKNQEKRYFAETTIHKVEWPEVVANTATIIWKKQA